MSKFKTGFHNNVGSRNQSQEPGEATQVSCQYLTLIEMKNYQTSNLLLARAATDAPVSPIMGI